MPELFGIVTGAYGLWLAQSVWHVYGRGPRARRAFAQAFREAQLRRVAQFEQRVAMLVRDHA